MVKLSVATQARGMFFEIARDFELTHTEDDEFSLSKKIFYKHAAECKSAFYLKDC